MDHILNYWFGKNRDNNDTNKWFKNTEHTKHYLIKHFEPLLQKAINKECEHWKKTNDGLLALILLTEIFPKIMYENSFRAYAFNYIAIECCYELINRFKNENNSLIYRFYNNKFENIHMNVFSLIPLLNSEKQEDLDILINIVNKNVSVSINHYEYTNLYTKAIKHKKILEIFKRYPERNIYYGRVSSDKEKLYLSEPSKFLKPHLEVYL